MSGKKAILIIDDNRYVRKILCDFFKLSGFKVYGLNDGIAALSLLKNEHYDIIITDYSMPGINGVELTKILRIQYPQTLIIGTSANCDEKDFLEAGADAFFNKPFNPQELLSTIQHLAFNANASHVTEDL
jgi:DNA-binding response OmpR family regulator